MNKLKIKLIFLLLSISIVSCIKEGDQAPNTGSNDCDDTHYVALQEKGDGLQLVEYIHAQKIDNVSHIEVSSLQPIFGFLEGTTMTYHVTGWDTGTVDDVEVWTLPVVVSQTSMDYEIMVQYFCNTEDGEIAEGYATSLYYNPGSLCEPGGVGNGGEFIVYDPIINDVPPTPNDTIRSKAFNIKFQTRPPSSDNEGFLFLFPIEEIESAYLEMDNGEDKLTTNINLSWFTSEWIVDEVYHGDLSYLSADISLTQVTAGLSPEELEKYYSIKFVIKRCGGKEFSTIIPTKF